MFARVATFEGGDRDRLRELNEERVKAGTIDPPAGLQSALVLEDRDSGRSLFVTFFDSRDAVAAAEGWFEQMGDDIPEELRGRRVGVDVYEVAFSLETADLTARP